MTLDPRPLRILCFIHTSDPSAPPENRAEEHKYHYFWSRKANSWLRTTRALPKPRENLLVLLPYSKFSSFLDRNQRKMFPRFKTRVSNDSLYMVWKQKTQRTQDPPENAWRVTVSWWFRWTWAEAHLLPHHTVKHRKKLPAETTNNYPKSKYCR